MDKETKDIIKPLVEIVAAVAEEQFLIIQLLSLKLPDLSDDERAKLQAVAQKNENSMLVVRNALDKLK